MKQCIIMLTIILCPYMAFCQSTTPILYGKTDIAILKTDPNNKWFDSIYHAYTPVYNETERIKSAGVKDIRIEVFYGTWCGDSRREVPRMIKILETSGVKPAQVSLIALGGSDSLYKQSPGKEESGKGIFRVPVFIVYKNGKEAGRINEYPVLSLEKDLYAILGGQEYVPNYKSFALIKAWLADSSLLNKNTSTRGMAMQLKWLVSGEHELNSVGYLLIKQGKKAEALRVFQINAQLYPESANIISSLGEGYLENGDNGTAVTVLERSLALNKDPALLQDILALLYKAKGWTK